MELKGKTILIISQQNWGEMFISKHHYAVELAKMGNTVYYLPGPDQENRIPPGTIRIDQTEHPNLFTIAHRLHFPYVLKFKARALYDYLLKRHINKLLRKILKAPDVIWSFDISNTIPLKAFPSSAKKIFMPVDELSETVALKAAETADVVFSVTNEILEKCKSVTAPKVFLNHGVSECFFGAAPTLPNIGIRNIGLSGNFLRPDIDHTTLLQIIRDNPNNTFHFWGSTNHAASNVVGSISESAIAFVNALKLLKNVKLHGQVSPRQLANEFRQVDCFLICYDILKDQSKGTNYHKVLEYLATGKVIVSNNITTYSNYPGLLEMIDDRDSNKAMSALFRQVVSNADRYNSIENQTKRIAFAKQFTYASQIKKIEQYLN
ncbi:MAG: hypothetical protein JST82_17095 [Bacteroidetes bacterium]|nr:hypothetical protein [Bacteroidota bacterium]